MKGLLRIHAFNLSTGSLCQKPVVVFCNYKDAYHTEMGFKYSVKGIKSLKFINFCANAFKWNYQGLGGL